jgi:ATP-dependent exoDNAse (exonuclease V) beta subunit
MSSTNRSTVSDAPARSAILQDLDDTLVVEAAAGTGKTTELVNRILSVLESGRATMTEIVAVTFTEKAAGELKLRLRERLEQARTQARDEEGRRRLDRALARLEEAHVNTIHGFCADLLRERPVEAPVDPLFAVLTESQSHRLYDRAFGSWLQMILASPPEGVRRALRRTTAPAFDRDAARHGSLGRLRSAGWTLAEARDYSAAWRRPPFDRLAEIERLIAALHQLARLTSDPASPRDGLYADTDAVRRLSRQVALEESSDYRDWDGWEARLIDLLHDRKFARPRKGSGYKFSSAVTRSEVLSKRDELYYALQEFKRSADADLAAALQSELADATRHYQTLKTAAGGLDFTDLLARARELIATNPAVRLHLQSRCRCIFVDEFQDTDPVQADILLLLSAANPVETESRSVTPVPGKLFIVGDPKQAIYRFRGTDVGTYRSVSDQIQRTGGRRLQLTTSYRSVEEIQRFVNAAFAEEMQADDLSLQPDYVPLSPYRTEKLSQPAVVALPVPRPYSRYQTRSPLKPSARAIEESLPDIVGAFIEWLVSDKCAWRVSERGADGMDRQERIQPRHVAVLFRRFVSYGQDVTRAYTDAIEARGIPHLLVGGKAFHGREEVETIRVALAAIEWPDDELSVFATLKGSLFAIDDEHLLEFRHRFRSFHPFRIPRELGGNGGQDLVLTSEPTGHLLPIADALRIIQRLHRARNYRPVADTVTRLLSETRAHVGFILRPAGEQALANVLHVAELARQYEAGGGISFRGFIDELRTASEGDEAEAPILEESSDGVRLMTVHKAKGLEFPIVILADLTCRLSRDDAGRYVDAARGLSAMRIGGWTPADLHEHQAEEVERDRAEGVRIAYVAATRARDLLVVPALGDEPWEGGWLSPLNRALYPPMQRRRNPSRGPACPSFKSKDSVLDRPNDEPAGATTVSPGQHTFDEHGYSVVWWDPGPSGGLVLGAKPSFGVRRSELVVKDVPKHVVADGRLRYDRWRQSRADAQQAGARASIEARTAHEWAADLAQPVSLPIDPQAVALVNLTDERSLEAERLGGPKFGILVHAVLARVPLDAPQTIVDDVARLEARILGLSASEANAAGSVVARVLRHEIAARAREAALKGRCRRETSITYTLANGVLVEGVLDLAFEERGRWLVVDYKTDRELGPLGEQKYRRQVALYAAAIQQSTGVPSDGVLVRI